MSQGWFKLHRELFEKAIWQSSTPEQKVILITLLGMANHQGKEWEWKGKQFKAEPGQFVTSIDSIIKRCGKGISPQNIKSAIKKFEKYNFLTNESTKTGRLITIVNWRVYQGIEIESNQQSNQQVTDNQPTTNQQVTDRSLTGNQQVTPNKNDKNNKNVKNDKKGEEGKEITSTQLTSFPTPFHEKIFNTFGEITYKTWFKLSSIEEKADKINIKVTNEFTKEVLENKFKEQLEIALGKKINIDYS